MQFFIIGLVSFLTGLFASMGLGGGMILIVYLTIIAGTPQLQAQGINLVFFIPIAILSLIMHTKNGLVKYKEIVPSIICGTVTTIIFSVIANKIDSSLLEKGFAVFLIGAGIRELMNKADTSKKDMSQ